MKLFMFKILGIRKYPVHPQARFVTPYHDGHASGYKILGRTMPRPLVTRATVPGALEYALQLQSESTHKYVRSHKTILLYRLAGQALPGWFGIVFASLVLFVGVASMAALHDGEVRQAQLVVAEAEQKFTASVHARNARVVQAKLKTVASRTHSVTGEVAHKGSAMVLPGASIQHAKVAAQTNNPASHVNNSVNLRIVEETKNELGFQPSEGHVLGLTSVNTINEDLVRSFVDAYLNQKQLTTGLVQNENGKTTAVVGGSPIVTYVPPVPSQGFGGASLAGFTTLSAEHFNSSNINVTSVLTVPGTATFTGTVNFTSSTVIFATTTLNGIAYAWPSADGSNGQVLTTNGAGQLSWTTAVGGSGSLSGGTRGYVATWASSTSLTIGTLIDNGTVAGINATSSSYTLNIQGSSGIHPLNIASSTGTSLVVVTQAGNVGIGTTTPSKTLSVAGDINFTGSLYQNGSLFSSGSGSSAFLFGSGLIYNATSTDLVGIGTITPTTTLFVQGTAGTNPFAIASSTGTQLLTVTQAGNVGIGSTTPAEKLAVAGNIHATGSLTAQAGLVLSNPAFNGDSNIYVGEGGVNTMQLYYNGTNNQFIFRDTVGGADILTLNRGDFNVGVGSSTPAARLSVKGAGASTGLTLQTTNSTNVPTFTILDNGNVGIGTTSPKARLDIWGNFNVGTSSTSTIFANTATGKVGIGTSTPGKNLVVDGTAHFMDETVLANAYRFYTGQPDGSTAYTDFRTNPSTGNGIISAKTASLFFNYDHGNAGTFWSNGNQQSYAYMSATGQLTLNNNSALGQITIPSIRNTLDANGAVAIGSYANTVTGPSNGLIVSGNVGVGTSSPTVKLDVWGNLNVGTSSVPNLFVNTATNKVGIGTSSAASAFTVQTSGGVSPFTVASSSGATMLSISSTGLLTLNMAGTYSSTLTIDNSYTNRPRFNSSDTIVFNPSVQIADSNFQLYQSGALGQLDAYNGMIFSTNSGQQERMRILQNGNIGIGTSTPRAGLHIGSNANGKSVIVASGWLCVDDNDSCTGATASGTVYAVNAYTTGADVAENYPTLDMYLEAGDVVSASKNVPSFVEKNSVSNGVLGVISTKPGVLLNGYKPELNPTNSEQASALSSATTVPVALAGRVPVKVTNENGNIQAGDFLTASKQFPGYAMKATQPGQVFGRALESFSSSVINDQSKILVFIQFTYYQPSVVELLQGTKEGLSETDQAWLSGIAQTQASVFGSLAVLDSVHIQKDLHVKGVVYAAEIRTDTLTTKKLCLDDVCVTKDQLKKLLDIINEPPASAGNTGTGNPENTEPPVSAEENDEEPAPAAQEPAPLETNEVSQDQPEPEQPAPEPSVPEPQPDPEPEAQAVPEPVDNTVN